jgi:hypothetical protein
MRCFFSPKTSLFVGNDIRKSQTHRISCLRAPVRKGFWASGAAGASTLQWLTSQNPFLANFRFAGNRRTTPFNGQKRVVGTNPTDDR